MEVPNGHYRVSWKFRDNDSLDGYGNFEIGCSAENHQIPFSLTTDWTQPVVHHVDVQDGKITIKGDATLNEERGIDRFETMQFWRCGSVQWIKFEQLSTPAPVAWLPASANPFWQLQLDKPTEIGQVNIRNRDQSDCGSHWLFRGNRCPDRPPIDNFTDTLVEGAIVRISDTPCAAGTAVCPGTICGRIAMTQIGYPDYRNPKGYLPNVNANCGGKRGSYVTVQLPGPTRILSPEYIHVNRRIPEDATQDTFVCVALEPADQTAVLAEYELSEDPEDPAYYSTCYARELALVWLPTPPVVPEQRWRFPTRCLTCKDYEGNAKILESQTTLPALSWHTTADQCQDCSREAASVRP